MEIYPDDCRGGMNCNYPECFCQPRRKAERLVAAAPLKSQEEIDRANWMSIYNLGWGRGFALGLLAGFVLLAASTAFVLWMLGAAVEVVPR